MKKIFRIICMMLVLILLFSINTKTYAIQEGIEAGRNFIETGENAEDKYGKIEVSELKDLSGYLYNILLVAGIVIAVIMSAVLGIQFMIGGAEGQAKVKEMLIPFVAGCVIVFGGFAIWKLAITVGDLIDEATETAIIESDDTYII